MFVRHSSKSAGLRVFGQCACTSVILHLEKDLIEAPRISYSIFPTYVEERNCLKRSVGRATIPVDLEKGTFADYLNRLHEDQLLSSWTAFTHEDENELLYVAVLDTLIDEKSTLKVEAQLREAFDRLNACNLTWKLQSNSGDGILSPPDQLAAALHHLRTHLDTFQDETLIHQRSELVAEWLSQEYLDARDEEGTSAELLKLLRLPYTPFKDDASEQLDAPAIVWNSDGPSQVFSARNSSERLLLEKLAMLALKQGRSAQDVVAEHWERKARGQPGLVEWGPFNHTK